MRIFYLCLLFSCFSLLKGQDTILIKNISKRYAYQIAVFLDKNSPKPYIEPTNHFIHVHKNDTLLISLKDKVLDKIIPFVAADSASVVAEYPLGVPSNQMFLLARKSGELVFFPSQVPNYQELVPLYEIFPCCGVLGTYMDLSQTNQESEVGKIFYNLYEAISAKKTFNSGTFCIMVSYRD